MDVNAKGKIAGDDQPGRSGDTGADMRDAWGYLRIVHRRWPWLLVGASLVIAAAAVGYKRAEVKWSARATVLIQPDQRITSGPSDLASYVPSPYVSAFGGWPSTQVGILTSRPTLDTARQLTQTHAELLRDLTEGRKRSLSPDDIRELLAALPPDSLPVQPEDSHFNELLGTMAVGAVQGTSIVEVSAASRDAREAHDFVNALCAAYLVGALERTQRVAARGLAYVQKQLAQAQSKLQRLEGELTDYCERTGVLQVDSQVQAQVSGAADLEARLLEARNKVRAMQAELQGIDEQLARHQDDTVEAGRTLVSNPLVSGLQQQLVDLNLERDALLEKFTEDSTKLKAIDTRIAAAKQAIEKEVEQVVSSTTTVPNPIRGQLASRKAVASAELQAAQAIIPPLASKAAQARSKLKDIPATQIDLARLRRELELAEGHYRLLWKKEEEYVLAKEAQIGGTELLEPARLLNKRRVGPRKLTTLVLGLLGGLSLGLLLVFVVETVDDTYPDVRAAEDALGMAAIGAIPRLARGAPSKLMHQTEQDAFRESLRSLYSNCRFASPGGLPRTIAVTSGQKGDGKTTVAANLALAACEAGLKALVVDADLRHPALHEVLSVAQAPGLAGVLTGDETSGDGVQEVVIGPKQQLWVLPAGSCQVTPQTILDSAAMTEFLGRVSSEYDLVVVDTPPLGGTSDAQIVASKCQSILLVFDPARTRRLVLRGACDLLVRAGANVLGLVANRVPKNRVNYYY